MDFLPHVDAASEAESVRNAWSNDCEPLAAQTSPSFAPNASLHPADDLSATADANQSTELENEEYDDFVEASTDPLKRPMYDTTEQEDENLELLNSKSVLNSKSTPDWDAYTFVGMGIAEPVRAGIGMTTRRVKKMARWKRNDTRANLIVAEWKRKRAAGIGAVGVSGALAAAAPSSAKDGVTGPATTPILAESNEHLQVPRAATPGSNMNGVMRPVRFAGSAIDEMVETERTAWGP